MNQLKLHSGSRIAIVGGGPAGAFFAHFALKLAQKRGLAIEVTVFDGKDFLRQGPPGCNMCAGVISETLLARLEEEGIRLPEERVQRRIDGYCMRTSDFSLCLAHPHDKKGAISTVYRGSGPRSWSGTTDISFDDFLLSHVRERGVRVFEQVVKEIVLPSDACQPVRLLCGNPESPVEYEADLVVGAFGLNTAILNKVVALGFGYRPPRFVHAFQAELALPADHIRRHLGNNIHILGLGLKRVRLAALTPKSEHVTVSVIGFKDADPSDLKEVLAHPAVRSLFPSDGILAGRYCRCRPRIATAAAKKPYTDRLVIVGDASCSRYYKNGIESAFVTAQLAAKAAFNFGISASAFGKGYYRQAQKTVVRDNIYGRLLLKVFDVASRHRILARTYSLVAGSKRRDDLTAQLARQILWDAFTGNAPYRAIFSRVFNLRLQARLTKTTIGLLVEQGRAVVRQRSLEHGRRDRTRESKG